MDFDASLPDFRLASDGIDRVHAESLQTDALPFDYQQPQSSLLGRLETDATEAMVKRQALTESLLRQQRKLELNRALQFQLSERLRLIDMLLARNEVQKKGDASFPAPDAEPALQENPEDDLREQKKNTRQLLLSFPPAGSALYFTRKRRNYPRFVTPDGKPLSHSAKTSVIYSQRWSAAQDRKLSELVLNQCSLVLHVQPSSSSATDDLLAYRSAKTEEEKQHALLRLLPSLLPQFSWEQIAHEVDHTTTDCFIHWLNCCDPSIRTSEWTLDEDASLQRIVEKTHGRNWVQVALQLGNGRTPFQCFERFVRVIEMKDYNRKWTEEEDKRVLEGVSRYGTKCWKKVALLIPRRTWIQCRSRYYQSLLQEGKKGRWSDYENCRLLLILLFFGMENWIGVSRQMVSRNASQCRDRWVNVLYPTNRRAPWSWKEDHLLLKLCAQSSPIVWKEVCKHLPGRTADGCKSRYNILTKYSCGVCLNRVGIVRERDENEREYPLGRELKGGSLASALCGGGTFLSIFWTSQKSLYYLHRSKKVFPFVVQLCSCSGENAGAKQRGVVPNSL